MRRLLLCIGAVLVGVFGVGALAFAGGQGPVFTSATVTFVVPHSSARTTWTLNLWSKGKLVGTDSATDGTLQVAVPSTPSCKFQADVLRDKTWYSGKDADVVNCGGQEQSTTTTTTTTTDPHHLVSKKSRVKPQDHLKAVVTPLKLSTTTVPASTAADGSTKPTPVSSTDLAFTGTGPGLWILVLAGSGLTVVGATLIIRARRLRASH